MTALLTDLPGTQQWDSKTHSMGWAPWVAGLLTQALSVAHSWRLGWWSFTSILLHLLLISEALLILTSFEISFWISYLSVLTRDVRTSTPWQPPYILLRISQRTLQLLSFHPEPLSEEKGIKFSCKRLGNRGVSFKHHLPYLADSDLTQGLFLHPLIKGVSFSFKAIQQSSPSISQ